MSKISTYNLADAPLQLSDRLIGTEAPRPIPSATPLATKNFSLGELLLLFSSNFPAASLQAVLDTNNTATEDINLTGIINTTLIKPGNIIDMLNSQGTPLQILSKGVGGICWIDGPNLSGYVPTSRELTINGVTYDLSANRSWTIGTGTQNLQEVTNEGNETTNPLIVFNNDGFYEQKSHIGASFIEVSDKDLILNETTRVNLETSGIRRFNIIDGGYMLDLTDASNAVPSTETRLLKAPILAVDEIIATETYVDNGLSGKQDTITLTTTGSGAATFVSNVLNIPTPPTETFSSLTTTGSSGASTLIGGVLNVPTYTLSGLGGQPLSTNLTSLSGLTYVSNSFVKMTAAGTFTLDTNIYLTTAVTSVAALTIGTTGTDITSTVVNGTTTPVITLNVPTASATNRGALSSADWTIFSNKLNSASPSYTGLMSGTGAAQTGSSAIGIVDLSQTWNTTGTPTAIRLNVTNTASNANSLLMDLQVGGSSQFQVTRGGNAGTVNITNFTGRTLFLQGGSSTSTNIIESNNSYSGTSGVFNIFSYSAGFSPTSGNALLRVLNIAPTINQTGGANGITRGLFINPTLTSAFDFRAIETTNGKVILTDTVSAGSGSLAGSLLDLSQTWNTTGTPTAIRLNVTDTASNTNSNLIDLRVGNVPRFSVTKSGTVIFGSTTNFSSIIPFGTSNADARLQITAGQGGVVGSIPLLQINTNNAITSTSTNPILVNSIGNFAPTSGTATYSNLQIAGTINQTGGANGITRGLFINPTLTSAADFRGIEVVTGSIVLPYVTASSTYAIRTQDYLVNFTSGTFTATLPTAVGCAGKEYRLKNSGTGAITIATTSSQTIDGVTTYSLPVQWRYVTVVSTGANWIIMENN